MKNKRVKSAVKIGGGFLAGVLAPGVVHGCACGCGVFDVATSTMLPQGQGGMAWVQYDYQDQNRNWSGYSQAPAANNGDKEIVTDFITTGIQYMFTPVWGAQLEVPYDYRSFKTTSSAPGSPITTINWWSLGDIRLEGIYTGFFPDQSAGVNFGLKLPTGNFSHENAYDDVDRDSEIGTGSTDILLGGFYRGNLDRNQTWDWYGQALLDVPTLREAGYLPGIELDSDLGIDYKGFTLGRTLIAPLAQVIFSERSSDSGRNAAGGINDNDNPIPGSDSGYQRLMLSPGLEIHIHPVVLYADAEFPVFQHFTGNQLVAPVLFKANISFRF
ncbi:MAG TPA: hypothetical protein VMH30_06140 [Verrucomicrobiae bacterium]|nr:hypothetical protein [Verrucomicrobiae bacterium]